MTAEAWGVSTDGGQTWNGGMTVDGDTVVRILDAVGVRANWINTGEFKVADEKGNEVFYVNCDTGSVRIKAQEFSLSGVSIEEIAAKKVDDFVTNIYKTDMDELKNSVRNKIETWYQSTDPSVNWGGTVEMAWCDVNGESILDVNGNEIILLYEESKAEHEGDLWKDLMSRDDMNPALFVSNRKPHNRMGKEAIWSMLSKLGKKTDIHAHPHKFRRTLLTDAIISRFI